MTNNDLAFLGLSHNPFVQTGDAFYPGGQRKRLLDQLSHLSQWSRRSLLVTGVAGSGKTTLCDHLASGMEPKAIAAKIHGEVATSRRDVLAAAAEGFGVAASRDAKAEVLDELVRAFVEEQQQEDRLCVILVDDTHRLDSRAIDTLLRLSLDCKVRIVMFAEPNVSRMVEEIGANLDIACHETQLIGFGQADVRGYLEWRFEQANYRGRVPFTDSQVETIAKVSSGLPGRIDELAGQELVRLSSGDVDQEESSFPLTHRMLIGMLVVVFGLLYLLVSGGDDTSTPTPEAETELAANVDPQQQNGATLAQTSTAQAAQAAMQPASEPSARSDRPDTTPLPDPQDNNQAKVSRPALPSEQEVARAEAAAETKRKQQAERLAAEKVAAAQAAADEAERVEKARLEKARLAQEAREAKALADRKRAEAAAEAKRVAQQQAQDQGSQTKPAAPAAAVAPAGADVERGERWLLLQDPAGYTLQLFTLSSPESVARYINRQADPGQFATYSFRRAGKRFHVVVYGLYSSKAAASAASVQLPKAMDVTEPWIRPMEQIQNTIRALPAG